LGSSRKLQTNVESELIVGGGQGATKAYERSMSPNNTGRCDSD
jgi:hypothetical protein